MAANLCLLQGKLEEVPAVFVVCFKFMVMRTEFFLGVYVCLDINKAIGIAIYDFTSTFG